MNRLVIGILLAGLCVPLGCPEETTDPDDDGGSQGGGGDDGKVHPEPNGVHISEDAACMAMRDAFDEKVQALGCTKTVRACPNFLRVIYDPDCAEYDEGAVQGCVDFYNGIFTCDLLVEDQCEVVHYPETAPAGCP